jgi:outer membrane protein, heavy metal efflux system
MNGWKGSVALVVLGVVLGSSTARAQGPTIPSPSTEVPGDSQASALGSIPGSVALPGVDKGVTEKPGDEVILRTAPGVSGSRVPGSILYPGRLSGGVTDGLQPFAIEPDGVPLYGLYEMPRFGECVGPRNGMTLDQAINRLCVANPELRGLATEIPQARADVLTSALRGNPLLFADAQQVPYGQYSSARPGGVRYDVSLTYPIYLSGKRGARRLVAVETVRVLEAMYQDAVRRKIADLFKAFVQALDAYERLRLACAAKAGIDNLLASIGTESDQNKPLMLKLRNRAAFCGVVRQTGCGRTR